MTQSVRDRIMARKANEGSRPVLGDEEVLKIRKAFDEHPEWEIVYMFYDGSLEGPDCGLHMQRLLNARAEAAEELPLGSSRRRGLERTVAPGIARQEALNQMASRGVPVAIGRGHSQIMDVPFLRISDNADQLTAALIDLLRRGEINQADNQLYELERLYHYAGSAPSWKGFHNLTHVMHLLINHYLLTSKEGERALKHAVAIGENYDPATAAAL